LLVAAAFLVLLACGLAGESRAAGYQMPLFRPAPVDEPSAPRPGLRVLLLADRDFAPYSFLTATGMPAGLAVDIALAACAEARLTCDVLPLPFEELLAALARDEGDAIIAGPGLNEEILKDAAATRPWFRLLGRFATLGASSLTAADAQGLAGKRVAVVAGTRHARWLETYYGTSEIVPFADEAAAGEALRQGQVDAMFGDNLRIIYWVTGSAAAGCCRLLGGAFTDFDFFSRNLSFLVRRDRDDVRLALDYGLDLAQDSGLTEKVFNAYVPLSPW
jgi:polar amino acid transport system substrate-binding protein